MSRNGIKKDGRKMSPMHVTLKAGIMRSQDQDCKPVVLLLNWKMFPIFSLPQIAVEDLHVSPFTASIKRLSAVDWLSFFT